MLRIQCRLGVLTCCVALGAARSARAQSRMPPSLAVTIDSLANHALAIDHTGGMTIGLVDDHGLYWTRSWGVADAHTGRAPSAATVYRIGSITKQFTALMLLRLARAGTVHLSDPADLYFPAIDSVRGRAPHAPAVTLVELATMRSGLPQEPESLAVFLRGPTREWEQVLERALHHTVFEAEPGVRWSYSNIGYATLGAALEKAAGRPYLDYVRDEILRPLGMTHTTFEPDSTELGQLAMGFSFDSESGARAGTPDTTVSMRERQGRGYKIPNGGLFSTVGDLARFLAFEMGNGPDAVLPSAELKRNFESIAFATPDLTQGYGLGFHVQRRGSLIAFGHPGSVAGYLATAYFDAASHTGVVVLRNVDDQKFDILGFTMTVLEEAVAAQQRASHNRE